MLRALEILLACTLAAGCGGGGGRSDDTAPTDMATPAPTATSTPDPSPTAAPSPDPAPPPAVLAAGANRVMRSDDGGFTWATEPELPLGHAIDFFDGQVGWVTGGGEIHHSTDGGRTWRREATELGPSPPYFLDLDAIDHARAVAAGYDGLRYTPEPQQGPPAIFFTHDGGTTWRRSLLIGVGPERSGLSMASICVTEAGHGLALGVDFATYAPPALLLVTHDSGATWQTAEGAPGTSRAAKIDCAGESNWWIADAGKRLFHSADAGTTWRDVSAALPDAGQFVAADFDGPTEGRLVAFADHRIVLLHMQDGGERWTTREIPASTGLLEINVGMDFHGEHGVVVLQDLHPLGFPRSSFGVAFATADDGQTWTETVFPPGINALWDVVLLP